MRLMSSSCHAGTEGTAGPPSIPIRNRMFRDETRPRTHRVHLAISPHGYTGRLLAVIPAGGDDDELARLEHVSTDRRCCARSHRRPQARCGPATTQAGWCTFLAGDDSLPGIRAADPV